VSRKLPEWVADHDDQAIPARVKLRLFEAADRRCQECHRPLVGKDKPQYDHIVALINGGEHRENNLRVLCGACHIPKTKADVREKSVIYQKKVKRLGFKRRKGFRGWRRFDGSMVWSKDRA
jgi:5-methylcytosine-specific restriction protein A